MHRGVSANSVGTFQACKVTFHNCRRPAFLVIIHAVAMKRNECVFPPVLSSALRVPQFLTLLCPFPGLETERPEGCDFGGVCPGSLFILIIDFISSSQLRLHDVMNSLRRSSNLEIFINYILFWMVPHNMG